MKKIILISIFSFLVSFSFAQSSTNKVNDFKIQSTSQTVQKDTVIERSATIAEYHGELYKINIGSRGGHYIVIKTDSGEAKKKYFGNYSKKK